MSDIWQSAVKHAILNYSGRSILYFLFMRQGVKLATICYYTKLKKTTAQKWIKRLKNANLIYFADYKYYLNRDNAIRALYWIETTKFPNSYTKKEKS